MTDLPVSTISQDDQAQQNLQPGQNDGTIQIDLRNYKKKQSPPDQEALPQSSGSTGYSAFRPGMPPMPAESFVSSPSEVQPFVESSPQTETLTSPESSPQTEQQPIEEDTDADAVISAPAGQTKVVDLRRSSAPKQHTRTISSIASKLTVEADKAEKDFITNILDSHQKQ